MGGLLEPLPDQTSEVPLGVGTGDEAGVEEGTGLGSCAQGQGVGRGVQGQGR